MSRLRQNGWILTFLVLAVLAAGPAAAIAAANPPPALDLKLFGQVGGQTTAVAVSDEMVYAEMGLRLAVLDVGKATYPRIVRQTPVRSAMLRRPVVTGVEDFGETSVIEKAGERVLELYAVDKSGNVSDVVSVNLRIAHQQEGR